MQKVIQVMLKQEKWYYINIYGKQLQYWNEELWKEHFGQNVYVRYNPEDLNNVRIYDEQKDFVVLSAL